MLASLGCGNPTALAELEPGEIVLDLGSGGGIDVLLSARRVGPTGKAYGLDMTDEMLELARENQAKAGVENVEFLKGQIEDIPLPDDARGRDHLQLRHQPLGRQGPGAARGVPRPEAGRPLRRVGRRRRGEVPARDPAEHAAVGRVRGRGALRGGVPGEARRRRVRRRRRSSRPGSTRSRTPREFLASAGIDVAAIAPEVDGKIRSAFIRAVKPAISPEAEGKPLPYGRYRHANSPVDRRRVRFTISAVSRMTVSTGSRLGPYEILAPLGAGGMGEVYRARDQRLRRDVAIKVLAADLSADADRRKRFEQEARAASSLNHPNIVTIYDIGSADGTVYIAMELIDGRTLRDPAERRPSAGAENCSTSPSRSRTASPRRTRPGSSIGT